MIRKLAALCLPALILVACGSDTQVLVNPPAPDLRLSPLVSSVEVRDISLPRYAAGDALVVLDNGVLQEVGGNVWADNPDRILTQSLARNIGIITGARTFAEPWPFSDAPGASVTVRVEQFLGQPDGNLLLTGQYAITPVNSGLSDRSGRFNISVPVVGNSPAAIADAQGRAIGELSEVIARRLGR